jgi:diguanylate cyclase (GGDEF)-like protein
MTDDRVGAHPGAPVAGALAAAKTAIAAALTASGAAVLALPPGSAPVTALHDAARALAGAAERIDALEDSRQSPAEGTPDGPLIHALSLLNATLESTSDGILVVALDGSIAGANEQFRTMWGIPGTLMDARKDDRVMTFVLEQLVDPTGFAARVQDLYDDADAESNDVLEFRDGRTFERYSRPQRVAGVVVGRVWSFRDATPRRRAEREARQAVADLADQADQIKLLAFLDPLTRLANRALFLDRLERVLAENGKRSVSVLLLDLDDFKKVNDILGHQAGDHLLVELGRRLRACVRATATVARLGGDEFVVLLEDCDDPDAVARRVVASLNATTEIHGRNLRPSVSLGLATTDDGSLVASDMMRRADIAMYAAKAAGKNRHLRFRPDMMTAVIVRADVEEGLRHAVAREEIIVHFQPIVAASEGEMTQVEALVRWNRPTRLVPPLDFIPAAESIGMINEIGLDVLAQACRTLRAWLEESALRSVAVNVSGVQLREKTFARNILKVVADSGVRPEQLVLEVTESVFLVPGRQVTDQLALLRERGIRVAIDDFGTGYSSLGRLQDLPVDSLKVDGTFVELIKTGTENLPILSSMIHMAHNLGLHVTAEGVETEAQAARLLDLGCDALQGYLFSRPQTAADLPAAGAHSKDAMRRLQSEHSLN